MPIQTASPVDAFGPGTVGRGIAGCWKRAVGDLNHGPAGPSVRRRQQRLAGVEFDRVAVGSNHVAERVRTGPFRDERDVDEVHPRRAEKCGGDPVRRTIVERTRWTDGLNAALVEKYDPVGQGDRFGMVMGDEDRRLTGLTVQPGDVSSQTRPEPGVEVRQRLIKQQHRRLTHQRPAQRDPLTFAAGEFPRHPVEQRRQTETLRHIGHSVVNFGPRRCLRIGISIR